VKVEERALADHVAETLERGLLAALVTIVHAPRNVGKKLLVTEDGHVAGDLGDAALNRAAMGQAERFLLSGAEAQTFRVEEFAPT